MNGIEQDLQGQADVVRINKLTSLGRELARRYDVTSATTTLVLDKDGTVIYRHAGLPSRSQVVEAVQSA